MSPAQKIKASRHGAFDHEEPPKHARGLSDSLECEVSSPAKLIKVIPYLT